MTSPAISDELASLMIAGEAPGVWGFRAEFEQILLGLDAALVALDDEPAVEHAYFPPVLGVSTLERSGYLGSFPHLLGSVHAFQGGEAEWREGLADGDPHDWQRRQSPTDVVMVPAACYHIYPLLSGTVPVGGRAFSAWAYCFRHEATSEIGRFKSFRIREFVRADHAKACLAWRDAWIERAAAFLRELGLDVAAEPAADPFFGRGHRLTRATQLEEHLKFELVAPMVDDRRGAIASMNYHRDHFGEHFGIALERAPEVAHTACVGFGLERVTLALANRHGTRVAAWPRGVREAIGL
jgi:seryl-tRNA synthetase